jgi:nucleoside 2-deoxyribosyltransferase
MDKTVYLAGPISGCSYDEASEWRDEVAAQLRRSSIKCLSPLRAKVYIRECVSIDQASPAIDFPMAGDPAADGLDSTSAIKAMSNSRGITTRDRMDCMNCSVLLVNFLGADRPSLGTAMEIAWADANRIPIVLIIEDQGNLHDHAMIRECVGFRVNNIEDAVEIIKATLGDY